MDAVPVQTLRIASTDITDPTTIFWRMQIPVEACESVWSTLRALLIMHYKYAKLNPLIRWVTYKKPNEYIKCSALRRPSQTACANAWAAWLVPEREPLDPELEPEREPAGRARAVAPARRDRPPWPALNLTFLIGFWNWMEFPSNLT